MQRLANLENQEDFELLTYAKSVRPFLKWAGGKAKLVPAIKALMPKKYRKYIEPFVGGGAMFFSTYHQDAVLTDSNIELMNCYKVVKEHPSQLLEWLEKLSRLEYGSKTYYEIRSWKVPLNQNVKRAARTIYLNRTAYNGLYRVNRQGVFNVPFGGYKNLVLPGSEVINNASNALQNAEVLAVDFQEALERFATCEDFVYLDPPYPAVGKYSDFNRYTKNFFSEKDHVHLSEQIEKLDEIGCKFVLSNAEHPLIRQLYSNRKFKIIKVYAPRYINCKGDKRGNVAELLITNNLV